MAFKISLGTISVSIGADTSGFKKGRKEIERGITAIDKSLQKNAKKFTDWSSNVSNAARQADGVFTPTMKGISGSIGRTSTALDAYVAAAKRGTTNTKRMSDASLNAANQAAKLTDKLQSNAKAVDAANKKVAKSTSSAANQAKQAAAAVTDYGKQLGSATGKADQASRSTRRYGVSLREVDAQTKATGASTARLNSNLKTTVFSLNQVAAAVGAALATSKVIDYADAYTNAQNKIKQFTSSTEELSARTNELFAVATRSRTEFGATADLYAQIARSTKDLGISTKQQVRLTETIGKAFTVSGATAAEAAGSIRQLGQAMASGVLRGDEFNSVAEQAPEIMEAIRRETGKTQGQLRDMAAQGKITVDLLIKSLQNYSDVIDTKAANATRTFSQSMQEARNQATKFVGENENIQGALSVAGEALVAMASNLDTLVKGVTVLGVALTARMIPALIGSSSATTAAAGAQLLFQGSIARSIVLAKTATAATRAWSVALGALGGPIGLAVTALAVLAVSGEQTKGWLTEVNEETAKFSKELQELSEAQKQVKADELADKIESVNKELEKLEGQAKRTSSGLLGTAAIQDQIKIQKLNQELVRLRKLQATANDSTRTLAGSLIEMSGPITQSVAAFGALASTFPGVREGFDQLSDSVKEAIDDFMTLTAEEKKIKLDNLNNEIDGVKSKIAELKDGLEFGILSAAFTEDGRQLAILQKQLDTLLEQKKKLEATKVETPQGEEVKQEDKPDKMSDKEFQAFLRNEKNKTAILREQSAERAILNALALEAATEQHDQEFDAMRAQSERIRAEEMARLTTKRELAAIELEEELKRIEENELLKDEQKTALEQELRAQQLERDMMFEDEKTRIEDEAAARREAIAEAERAAKMQMAKNTFEGMIGVIAQGSKKAQKIQKSFAIGNAVIKGYEAAVAAWDAGMSVGGPWAPVVAAGYTAASLVKTAGLIQNIKSAGNSSSQKRSAGGAGVTPGAGVGGGGAVGGGGQQGQGQQASRNITINLEGNALLNTDQVRGLIGQINEQVGDGVELRATTSGG